MLDITTAALILVLGQGEVPPTASASEWLGLRTVGYLLGDYPLDGNWRCEYDCEIAWARNQIRTPPLWHASRFPSHEYCAAHRDFATGHVAWLEMHWWARGAMDGDVFVLLSEARRRLEIWQTAASVNSPYAPPYDRRRNLESLRELLTDKEWWTGELPAHVPVAAFRRLD